MSGSTGLSICAGDQAFPIADQKLHAKRSLPSKPHHLKDGTTKPTCLLVI
jgi:hypothetical protein